MVNDEFKALRKFDAGKGSEGCLYSLPALEEQGIGNISRLPVSIRIVLEDCPGVPLVVELAAMGSAVQQLGGDRKMIEPLVPVDLVVDHSVQVDFFGSARALELKLEIEYK